MKCPSCGYTDETPKCVTCGGDCKPGDVYDVHPSGLVEHVACKVARETPPEPEVAGAP